MPPTGREAPRAEPTSVIADRKRLNLDPRPLPYNKKLAKVSTKEFGPRTPSYLLSFPPVAKGHKIPIEKALLELAVVQSEHLAESEVTVRQAFGLAPKEEAWYYPRSTLTSSSAFVDPFSYSDLYYPPRSAQPSGRPLAVTEKKRKKLSVRTYAEAVSQAQFTTARGRRTARVDYSDFGAGFLRNSDSLTLPETPSEHSKGSERLKTRPLAAVGSLLRTPVKKEPIGSASYSEPEVYVEVD